MGVLSLGAMTRALLSLVASSREMDSMVDAPAAKPAEESMQDPPPDVLDAKDEAALLRRVSELLADGTPAPTARLATPRRYAQFDLEQGSESADRRTARCCGR